MPRNRFGIVIIGLLLGVAPLMLWMGRWRLALTYLVISFMLIAALFASAILGLLPMQLFRGIDPSIAVFLLRLPVALAGIVQALAIRQTALDRPWYSRWYIALPSLMVLGLVMAFGVRNFIYHPFTSPTQSMWPSQMIGDYFVVSKAAYSTHDPQRGEIAVFSLPSDDTKQYVKRIIGLPGDRVQMVDGTLQINDEPVMTERIEANSDFLQDKTTMLYRETLPGGSSHVIADERAQSDGDNTDEYLVPEGYYFVMGDNRDNSFDSRYSQFGFVPRQNFIGPFVFRFWNDQGIPLVGRPE